MHIMYRASLYYQLQIKSQIASNKYIHKIIDVCANLLTTSYIYWLVLSQKFDQEIASLRFYYVILNCSF